MEQTVSKAEWYNDQDYLDELSSRAACYDFEAEFNFAAENIGAFFRLEDVELGDHYDTYFAKDVDYNTCTYEAIEQLKLENTRVFKFLIGRYGLTPEMMFTPDNSYIEVTPNYFSAGINERLDKLVDVLYSKIEEIQELAKEQADNVLSEIYNNNEYFQGSESDYLEWLENKDSY